MTLYRVGDLRISRLADCDLWRIERLTQPRWIWRVLGAKSLEWRAVYRIGLFMFEPVPAEFFTLKDAERALLAFRRGDEERHSRSRSLWTPEGNSRA